MVVVTAFAGAAAVVAAASTLGALIVALAIGGVFAPTMVAMSTVVAIPVVAALRANAGIALVAADQPVAAVVLVTVSRRESAVVAGALAALVFRHTLVATAAFIPQQAEQRSADTILTAYVAVATVGVVTALWIGALTNFVTNSAADAIVARAALCAVGAFLPETAAILPFRTLRNVSADARDASDAGAKVGGFRDAVAVATALGTSPIAAELAIITAVDARAALADLACSADDLLALARQHIARRARIFTTAGIDAYPVRTGRRGTGIGEETILPNRLRRTFRLRTNRAEMGGNRHASHCSTE
jgi:hypothetical protein